MLHGNGSVLHKSPARFLAGSTTSTEPQLRAGWGKSGMSRNRFFQDRKTVSLKNYSVPEGSYAGVAWLLPQKAAALASHRNASLSLGLEGLCVGGVTATGLSTLTVTPAATARPLDDSVQIKTASASISLQAEATAYPLIAWVQAGAGSTGLSIGASATALPSDDSPQVGSGAASMAFSASAIGDLIARCVGTAPFSLNTNAPLLTSAVQASGTAAITLTTSALLGAKANSSGSAAMLLSGSAQALPLDDSPPARTASASMGFSMAATILPLNSESPLRSGVASFAISGALTPYAIGQMVGSTLATDVLTTDTIATAVWQSLAASFTASGTMGQKLNNAASGGVDYGDLASAVWNHTQ